MITQLIFRCGQCQSPSPQKGARAKFVLGLRVRVCAKCAEQMKPPKADGELT